ncbi:hypothetical protein BD324DRAFT_624501 [Kockovaella imperatae]|uniref:Uncharacterized protein n=1 Tax=Kockovaella imperatae TaxID=4999 RepID=A0A1Y1UG77_9TREE|nr:hypothetical protein BD324DRAFT_624501 [Kockovaella imperatae]ORX37022.1 hypothetical protein BD324DRAFT_624501 [Kockovaella imperatae]
MSPVPPPAGVSVPSENWDEDDSFDFDPNSSNLVLASSSSPSESSSSPKTHPPHHVHQHHQHHRHGSKTSISQSHISSPLRQSHLNFKAPGSSQRNDNDDDEDEVDFDLDLPDSFPAQGSPQVNPRLRSNPSSSHQSIRNLPAQIIGQGPKGVGTVTRLGSTGNGGSSRGPSKPTGLVSAHSKAIERAWENDVDFDSLDDDDVDEPLPSTLARRLTLSPPKARIMPGPDALDDIDLDLEDGEATLKAGATIKAMLPPKRVVKPQEDELENDFVLPLNVRNLTLATASHVLPGNRTVGLPDSPSTSTSGKKSGSFSWGDSPKRRSETSVTSLTDGPSKVIQGSGNKGTGQEADLFGEEEDMEDGIIIPSGTFFSSGQAKELNKILDRKRRGPPPIQAPTAAAHHRQGTDDMFRTGDESIEDGLVLENPRTELSRRRLDRAVKARTPNSQLKKHAKSGGGATTGSSAAREARERAWEKQREHGWGRHIPSQPLPSSSTGRAQSALGFTGRSHSSGTVGLNNLASASKRDTSAKDSTLSRTRMHSMAMLPPPIPESRDGIPPPPTTPSSSSRLRHQKSFHHIPPQSPSLARKQSLASLQDAMTSGSHPLPTPPSSLSKTSGSAETPGRYHHSTSRLTMPTSSSLAKSRPPLNNIFPKTEFTASSSASSISSGSREMASVPRSKSGKGSWGRDQLIAPPATMSVPRKGRRWDGNELDGIEDIPVDGKSSGSFGRSKSRKALDLQAMGSKPFAEQVSDAERRRLAPRSMNKPRIGRRMPALISHKGRNDKVIVVGDMTFNPRTQRWEGNEAMLRDFDPPTAPSVRPALITHYTGSSVGGVRSPLHGAGGPGGSGYGGGGGGGTVRIVGNMMFDPEKMCWVSTLAPEDDEPDPFANMADDEDEDVGGTITRATAKRFVAVGGAHMPSSTYTTGGMKTSQSSTALSHESGWSSRMASESSMSAMSWDERGGGLQGERVDIPVGLIEECREAEERHKKEMRGWMVRAGPGGAESDKRDRGRREEKRLWEIRVLATS